MTHEYSIGHAEKTETAMRTHDAIVKRNKQDEGMLTAFMARHTMMTSVALKEAVERIITRARKGEGR